MNISEQNIFLSETYMESLHEGINLKNFSKAMFKRKPSNDTALNNKNKALVNEYKKKDNDMRKQVERLVGTNKSKKILSKIDNMANSASKSMFNKMNSYNNVSTKADVKKVADSLTDIANESKKNFISEVTDWINDNILYEFDSEIAKSIFTLLMVVYINSISYLLLLLIFGYPLGYVILATCVAPVTEEFGKLLAVKFSPDHTGKKYNIIFNTYEFLSYVTSGTSIVARIPAIILHTVNQNIIAKKFGEEKEDDVNRGSSGVVITMVLHSLFNAFCTFGLLASS